VTQNWKSQTFTSEFGHEIEAERERWLRRRFLWYAGAVFILNLLPLLLIPLRSALPRDENIGDAEFYLSVGSGLFTLALYGGAFWYVKTKPAGKVPPLRIVFWLIVITGMVQVLSGPILARGLMQGDKVRVSRNAMVFDTGVNQPGETSPPPTEADSAPNAAAGEAQGHQPAARKPSTRHDRALTTVIASGLGAFSLLSLHFFACLFLPWTPAESIRPLVPLLILNAFIMVAFMAYATFTGVGSFKLAFLGALFIVLSAVVALPGAAICWWRNSRFRDRFSHRMLRGRYMELRQELTNARTIHESLFPRPHLTGPIRFNYVYEPMRQIGGDYLYASFHTGAEGRKTLSIALIDVTGHGIPAALTVNRLHGELERIFAEHPGIAPGEVLRLLNSYVHLTLATHSVYVTAVCFRVHSDANSLDYASGGHPPAFIRTGDGRVEQLDSTSFVLGACAGSDFQPAQKSIPFHVGDTLIAYTDGALEARDKNGRFLGVAGMMRIIASARATPGTGVPAGILKAVEEHRYGPTEDDTLVIEVTRPVDATPDPQRKTGIFTPAAAP
jgi:hypothetical protein